MDNLLITHVLIYTSGNKYKQISYNTSFETVRFLLAFLFCSQCQIYFLSVKISQSKLVYYERKLTLQLARTLHFDSDSGLSKSKRKLWQSCSKWSRRLRRCGLWRAAREWNWNERMDSVSGRSCCKYLISNTASDMVCIAWNTHFS